MFRKFLFFFLQLLCIATMAFAQENELPSISIKTDSTFFAENGSLAALTLAIENENQAAFNGKIELKTIDGINLIGKENISISLDAKSKIYYPIRLSVNKNVPAGETPVILQLVDINKQVKATFTSKLIVQSKKQVQLISNRPTELMQNVGDSLSVSALLSNKGNSKEMITITASFPNLTGGNKVESKQVFLNAFQDSVITFKKIITKELLRVERYTVNLAALYENGELINNVMVTVQNVSGNRTYSDPSQGYSFDSYSNNKISLSGRNLFTDNEALQLNGRGIFQLPAGSMDFNVDGYLYTRTNSRPLLTNTYLNYKLNNKGIMLGNISESLETFVNGRGVKVYAGDIENNKLIEVGVVDKSYNLLGDEYKLVGGNGYTAYAKTYLNNQSNQQYAGSILYDRTPYSNSESLIQMNEYQYRLKDNIQLGFELGGGLTRILNNPSSSFKPSAAIGNKLSGRFGNYNISSNNFYSSGYYPGTRRGVLQLNERVSRSFNKLNTWLSYSYYNYDPKYLQTQYLNYSSNTSNSQVEAGTYFPLSDNMSLNLSAKKYTDQGRVGYNQEIANPMLKMNAFRLTESVNWRSRNDQHMVYLSSENGFAKSPYTGENQLQIRANATWNYRFFTLNSYFQQGDFSLIEAYSNALQKDKDQYRFNISNSVRKEFFNKKLQAQLDVNYNRDSYSGSNWMYSGLVNYAFSPLFSGFVNTYFYKYNSSYFNSSTSNIQAGISYNLPDGRNVSTQKKGNLTLFLFYDNNTNGVFDEGDTVAESRIATIGGISFISLNNGLIEYKKVPYGEYTLQVPSQDWYAVVPSKINIQNRELTLNVPLQKTGKIVGNLSYNYDERTSMEVSEKHGGLRVWVTGTNGNKIEALTNSQGNFTLFVPVGQYDFSVDDSSLPKNVFTEFETQNIIVEAGRPITIPEIELKVKQRVIEVKRFSSE